MGKVLETYVPELLRRALFTGAGMLFLTEEGLRKTLGEFNLPRDAVNYLIKQSEKGRDELLPVIQRELARWISRVDVSGLVREIVDGLSFEVHTTITIRADRKDRADEGNAAAEARSAPRRKKRKD